MIRARIIKIAPATAERALEAELFEDAVRQSEGAEKCAAWRQQARMLAAGMLAALDICGADSDERLARSVELVFDAGLFENVKMLGLQDLREAGSDEKLARSAELALEAELFEEAVRQSEGTENCAAWRERARTLAAERLADK